LRNIDRWTPSKFVFKGGKLRASRDPQQVSAWSRLGSDITAEYYSNYLPQFCRGRLLDLGCGHVPFFEAYRDLIDEAICIDWPNSLHRNEFLDHECDITKPLPIPDRSIDTIILSDVLEHLPQPEKTWEEMARVLRPAGAVILNVPFFYGLHEQPHDYYRYTEFALRRFATNAGFEVVVLEPMGGVPEIMADLIAKTLRRLKAPGRALGVAAQFLCGKFVKTGFGRKVSEATREQFPTGYFMVAKKL